MARRRRLNAQIVLEMRNQHYDLGLCVKCIAKLRSVNYFTAYSAIKGYTWGPLNQWHRKERRA